VISIEPITQTVDRFSATVNFTDITITPDKDLAVILRHGVYELVRTEKGEWTIKSYTDELPKGGLAQGERSPAF
jgi:hypothetical protein